MRYRQACDEPHLMIMDQGVARCPGSATSTTSCSTAPTAGHEKQTKFAHWLRASLAPVVDTAVMTPATAAGAVAAGVDDRS